MDAPTPALTALRQHVAGGTTACLLDCLLRLDAITSPEDHEKRAKHEVVEELIRRFPDQCRDALASWSQDLESDLSLAQAIAVAIPLDAVG